MTVAEVVDLLVHDRPNSMEEEYKLSAEANGQKVWLAHNSRIAQYQPEITAAKDVSLYTSSIR